ncbi:MAG: hypothetical protein F6K16_41765 [Symploca sp. SIO2B6]|nr:hypothetical protein [Symploca sp. SIO2B6]
MSNQSNQSSQSNQPSITGLSSVPPRLSQQYVDELLSRVGAQVANKTFDITQDEVFKELVEALGDVRGMKRLRAATLLGEEIGTPSTRFLMDALLEHVGRLFLVLRPKQILDEAASSDVWQIDE